MGQWIYINGEIITSTEAKISPEDRGLLYGDGVFETMRVYRGRPFLLEKHIERMLRGSKELEINLGGREQELNNAVKEVIEANGVDNGSLRLTLTRGTGPGGLWPTAPESFQATVMASARPAIPYTSEDYDRGFKAALISFPRNELSPVTRLKSLNFLENILGRKEAQQKETDEGLFINHQGYLAEGTISNIFLVDNGVLYTPPEEAGLLPGITREIILELGEKICQKAVEENLTPSMLKNADEAFLTNSLLEVMPLVELDGKPINSGKPGKTSEVLRERYRDYVKKHV